MTVGTWSLCVHRCGDASAGMLGSSVLRELLWLFFVPITVFDLTLLPLIRTRADSDAAVADKAATEAAAAVRSLHCAMLSLFLLLLLLTDVP